MAPSGRWVVFRRTVPLAAALALGVTAIILTPPGGRHFDIEVAWTMHVIVPGATGTGAAAGADGVALADVDGDGDLDVTAPYEDGHRASLSLNPGPGAVEGAWSTAIVPTSNVVGPEDAFLADVDGDGWKDIILGGEGSQRIWVLFSPTSVGQLMTPSAWTRVSIEASLNTRWMRVVTADMDGNGSLDIVAGGKEGSSTAAALSYFRSATPRVEASWTVTPVAAVGWVMSLEVGDLDGDGDLDILYSDRQAIATPSSDATRLGVRWLESNGATPPTFTNRAISANLADFKFLSRVDWEGDGDVDILACRSNISINESFLYLNAGNWLSWSTVVIPQPLNVAQAHDVNAIDVDGDGDLDVAFTYSATSIGTTSGLVWLRNAGTPLAPIWHRGEIDGGIGTKYDNAKWLDLDADGDLDVLTSEQFADTDGNATLGPGRGVIWFENPL